MGELRGGHIEACPSLRGKWKVGRHAVRGRDGGAASPETLGDRGRARRSGPPQAPQRRAGSLLALVQQPAEYARLRACPGLIAAAVEEMLRHSGIVRRVFRRTVEEIELGGVTIPEGQTVALMLADANRDPAQFPDPDRLDFD